MNNSKSIIVLKSSALTLLIFLLFSSFNNAQSSSPFMNISNSTFDYLYPNQKDYSNLYSIQRDYSNTNSVQRDYSNILTPAPDQSDIYAFNGDLIDSHNPSLYESIHSNENNGSLLIVKNDAGKIISIINLNGEEIKQND